MENDKRLKLQGLISDYMVWDDTINDYAEKFYSKHNVYPNILEANEFTLNRIDLIAQKNPNRVVNSDDGGTIETSDLSYEGLNCFIASEYSLELCLDYQLSDGAFTLIFDENPDFDGLPKTEEEEKEEGKEILYVFKKSA